MTLPGEKAASSRHWTRRRQAVSESSIVPELFISPIIPAGAQPGTVVGNGGENEQILRQIADCVVIAWAKSVARRRGAVHDHGTILACGDACIS